MSHNVKAVNRTRPCPICGKPDWCGFWTSNDGAERVICKRTDIEQDCTGCDGRTYKFIRRNEGGHSVFEEMSGYEAREVVRKDEWMKENKVGPYNPRWQFPGMGAVVCKKDDTHEKKVMDAREVLAQAPQKEELTVVDEVKMLPHRELDRIYRTMLSFLVLDAEHEKYLKDEGWDDKLLAKHQIRSFPEADFVRFKYKHTRSKNPYRKALARQVMEALGLSSLEGVPGAFMDVNGNWTFAGQKGILFPTYDADGWLYGFRIRMDFMAPSIPLHSENGVKYYDHMGHRYYLQPMKGFYQLDENGTKVFPDDQGYHMNPGCENSPFKETSGKYRPLTSYYADEEAYAAGYIKNSYNKGCQQTCGVSLYYTPGVDNPKICYVTEGEKKGIFSNAHMKAPIMTFPGVDAFGGLFEVLRNGKRWIDILKGYGVELFVILYDADKAHNKAVLNAEWKVVERIRQEDFFVGVGGWDINNGKGLDDLLANGYMPGFTIVQ